MSPSNPHLLFPVDFSTSSIDIIPAVKGWAKRRNAKVTLLHTLEPDHGGFANWYAYINLMDVEGLRSDARRRLADLAASAFDGLEYQVEVREGAPAEEIVSYARVNGVDLIMMPTAGQGKLRRLLLGSVTAKVLYDAECPVWTVGRQVAENLDLPAGPILCAVDGSAAAVDVIRVASALSKTEDADVELVHVIPDVWSDPELSPADARNLQSMLEASAHRRVSDLQVQAGVEFPVAVTHGDVAKALSGEAGKRNARLLVIGRGHLQASFGRMRTHVNAIIERAPCPVFSV